MIEPLLSVMLVKLPKSCFPKKTPAGPIPSPAKKWSKLPRTKLPQNPALKPLRNKPPPKPYRPARP